MSILKLIARFKLVEERAALLIAIGQVNSRECQDLLQEHEALKELIAEYVEKGDNQHGTKLA